MSEVLEGSRVFDWTNADNIEFYESIPIGRFKNFARLGGFDQGCDLDLILSEIKKSKDILEVGAGYGRVVDYLIQKSSANVHAIERSKKLYSYIKKKYEGKANIIFGDIATYAFDKRFDIVIWLWSNISDFSKKEHISILKKLATLLNKDGILVTDILLNNFSDRENITSSSRQNYIVEYGDIKAYGYSPTKKEMVEYAKAAGLKKPKMIPYITSTNRRRLMFVYKLSHAQSNASSKENTVDRENVIV